MLHTAVSLGEMTHYAELDIATVYIYTSAFAV